jgi:tungstate transport system substrate-binding protein
MHRLSLAPHWRRFSAVALAVVLAVSLAACGTSGSQSDTPAQTAKPTEVILASTTSTQDSGLFDVLIPAFEKANPEYVVKVIAVGTGEALKLGEQKDADVLLVHAKASEEQFVASGYGVARYDVMYNDFVILGSSTDPAKVKGSADISAAMQAIQSAGKAGKVEFISRGDDSGTHKAELKLWAAASITPTPTPEADKWYVETGQGMGETLKIASEKQAYTMSDRATYLSMKDALDLEVVFEKDKALFNQYGVIVVTGAKNQAGGQAFQDWILSSAGQEVIAGYGVEKFGQALFIPNAQ